MDKRTAIGIVIVTGVLGYAIGYRIGVGSMVREWQREIAPSFASYLAAKDTVEGIIDPDED